VRPELASRPLPHILEEVRRLTGNGYREVVLTGIHLGHYGIDWNRHERKENWTRLSHLVRAIAELPGDFRVRLSSIEATEVTRELIDVMSEHPKKVCPHLHISMQSGSDGVLRRMRRRWGAQRFVDRCELLKEQLDRPAITTDIIVGFPGETDAEFAETCDVACRVGFSKIHMFPFSARRGTPAAEMPNQISKLVKHERGQELARIEVELQAAYFASLAGMQLRVLAESPIDGSHERVVGTSCRYTPVELPAYTADFGEFVDVVAGPAVAGRIQAMV
jgi:threonylcarbamoyladenosine tRNA methylthiotransferase MtaB